MGGGCDFDGNCHGSYGPIADAFIRVPDNFNSVTNFVPKLPVYRTLRVTDKAVSRAYDGYKSNCCEKGCCDTGRDSSPFDYNEDKGEDMGFILYPHRIRPNAVTVCGKALCHCKDVNCNEELHTTGCCGKASCTELEGAYINWPPIGYFKSVKACGKITTEACKKHGKRDCKKCKVIAKCDKDCKKCCDCDKSSCSTSTL